MKSSFLMGHRETDEHLRPRLELEIDRIAAATVQPEAGRSPPDSSI